MQNRERRKEERIALTRSFKGELKLLVGAQAIRVNAVKDISPQGLRVLIDVPVKNDVAVRVAFHDEAVDLQVNGTVAWNSAGESATPGGGYIVGINLVSPMLLHAFL